MTKPTQPIIPDIVTEEAVIIVTNAIITNLIF